MTGHFFCVPATTNPNEITPSPFSERRGLWLIQDYSNGDAGWISCHSKLLPLSQPKRVREREMHRYIRKTHCIRNRRKGKKNKWKRNPINKKKKGGERLRPGVIVLSLSGFLLPFTGSLNLFAASGDGSSFHLWLFLVVADGRSKRSRATATFRRWMRVFGGVRHHQSDTDIPLVSSTKTFFFLFTDSSTGQARATAAAKDLPYWISISITVKEDAHKTHLTVHPSVVERINLSGLSFAVVIVGFCSCRRGERVQPRKVESSSGFGCMTMIACTTTTRVTQTNSTLFRPFLFLSSDDSGPTDRKFPLFSFFSTLISLHNGTARTVQRPSAERTSPIPQTKNSRDGGDRPLDCDAVLPYRPMFDFDSFSSRSDDDRASTTKETTRDLGK